MRKQLLQTIPSLVMVFAFLAGPAAAHQDVTLKNAAGNPVTASEAYSPKATCGACHNYGSDETFVTHTQGLIESDNNVYWQSYDVKLFDHGVSKGRHSGQGRNESYTDQKRSVFALPFFTSSMGMFGKY